jgi:hypothetical protein
MWAQGLLGFSIYFTVYYSDRQDREPFAMLVTILSLTLCLTTVALFPVDIFMVSKIMDPTTGLRYGWATDAAIGEMQQTVQMTYAGMCTSLSGPFLPCPCFDILFTVGLWFGLVCIAFACVEDMIQITWYSTDHRIFHTPLLFFGF